MNKNLRRQAILEMLCERNIIKTEEFAARFDVSKRTIRTDIEVLSLKHPIRTIRGRYDGGVCILSGYELPEHCLSSEQIIALQEAMPYLDEANQKLLQSIIDDFSMVL